MFHLNGGGVSWRSWNGNKSPMTITCHYFVKILVCSIQKRNTGLNTRELKLFTNLKQ